MGVYVDCGSSATLYDDRRMAGRCRATTTTATTTTGTATTGTAIGYCGQGLPVTAAEPYVLDATSGRGIELGQLPVHGVVGELTGLAWAAR